MLRRATSSSTEAENLDTSKSKSPKKPNLSISFRHIRLIGAVTIVLLFYIFFFIIPNYNNANDESNNLQRQMITQETIINGYEFQTTFLKKSLKDSNQELLDTKQNLEKTTKMLHKLEEQQKKKNSNEDNSIKHAKKIKKENNLLKDHVNRYTKKIQVISRREVEEKFGPGPHRVEITLDFPPEAPFSLDDITPKFIIELAPLDLMPHSVYLFLQQVSHKCWNGRSFHRNAEHVIQAGTETYYNTPKEMVDDDGHFNELHLEEISFQEYSEEYPHALHTVGFAGRPGGPDWYISMEDNTENHGPGGQGDYSIKGEADPCFGKVVEGLDVVSLMHKMPKEPGDFEGMKYNVGIKSAKIL